MENRSFVGVKPISERLHETGYLCPQEHPQNSAVTHLETQLTIMHFQFNGNKNTVHLMTDGNRSPKKNIIRYILKLSLNVYEAKLTAIDDS